MNQTRTIILSFIVALILLFTGLICGFNIAKQIIKDEIAGTFKTPEKAPSLIRSLFQGDNKLEKSIEEMQKKIDELDKQFWDRANKLDGLIKEIDRDEKYIKKTSGLKGPIVREIANCQVYHTHRTGIENEFSLAAWTQESHLNPFIPTGDAGEEGVTQVTDQLWALIGQGSHTNWRDTYRVGFNYMVDCLREAKGNKELALAYYNAGMGPRAREKAALHIKRVMRYYKLIKKEFGEV